MVLLISLVLFRLFGYVKFIIGFTLMFLVMLLSDVMLNVVALHMYLVVSDVMFTYLNVNGSVLSNGVVLKFPIILAFMV